MFGIIILVNLLINNIEHISTPWHIFMNVHHSLFLCCSQTAHICRRITQNYTSTSLFIFTGLMAASQIIVQPLRPILRDDSLQMLGLQWIACSRRTQWKGRDGAEIKLTSSSILFSIEGKGGKLPRVSGRQEGAAENSQPSHLVSFFQAAFFYWLQLQGQFSVCFYLLFPCYDAFCRCVSYYSQKWTLINFQLLNQLSKFSNKLFLTPG